MKLRYSPTSPYVRKVLVTAIELGLEARIERISKDNLVNDNPLDKIPTLIMDDGEALYDSPVICEYLDSLNPDLRLFPPAGPARWRVLRQQALCDGVLDAAILRMLESKRRPEGLRWAEEIAKQGGKVGRALDRLEAEVGDLEGDLTIGQIAAGCTLGYLDFRFGHEDWRPAHPKLAAWQAEFAKRPSMLETVPKDPT
jgi:glutathione S-transferase